MDDREFVDRSTLLMPSMFRMAYSIVKNRQDAEDTVQQALLKAWKARFKAKAGYEQAWLMRIVINEAITLLRKRKGRTTVQLPEIAVWPEERNEQLHVWVDEMPIKLRTPFLLKYMEGMTEKEVAEALRIPQSSVKNRLLRARRYMQEKLHEEEL